MKRLTLIAVLAVLLVVVTLTGSFRTVGMEISNTFLEEDPVEDEGVNESRGFPEEYGSAHKHLLFKAVIANNTIDFSKDKFQLQSRLVHFENGNGEILHVHAKGIDIGRFLSTLDMEINSTCIEIENTFCSNETHDFRVYVNNQVISRPDTYVMEQGDHIMLWYGKRKESPERDFFERDLPDAYRPYNKGRNI